MEERRKSTRFRIPFNVEVLPSSCAADYVPGDVRDFSPEGFSFEAKNIDLGINHNIKARFRIYPEADYINVTGRIMWKIQFGTDSQVGVEIDEIDIGTNENLGYPFNMWKAKMRSR